MKGKYELVIRDSRISFNFVLDRHITVIKGNSGTGKSTLYNMFRDSKVKGSGIHCNYSDKLYALNSLSENWVDDISKCRGKFIIIDETFPYTNSVEFARVVNNSDNYFIIISRGSLKYLTFAVNSIKFIDYKSGYYQDNIVSKYTDTNIKLRPDLVIVEDSKSGFEMFSLLFNCKVVSANGKDNVVNTILKYVDLYKCIYIIVDGAAFGSSLEEVLRLSDIYNINIFTPESFEYLLLNTDKIYSKYLTNELINTFNYADSVKFLSWERYYTHLLQDLSYKYLRVSYNKSNLDKFFKSDIFKDSIKSQLKDIQWD